jgi:hypothetical protein
MAVGLGRKVRFLLHLSHPCPGCCDKGEKGYGRWGYDGRCSTATIAPRHATYWLLNGRFQYSYTATGPGSGWPLGFDEGAQNDKHLPNA